MEIEGKIFYFKMFGIELLIFQRLFGLSRFLVLFFSIVAFVSCLDLGFAVVCGFFFVNFIFS